MSNDNDHDNDNLITVDFGFKNALTPRDCPVYYQQDCKVLKLKATDEEISYRIAEIKQSLERVNTLFRLLKSLRN